MHSAIRIGEPKMFGCDAAGCPPGHTKPTQYLNSKLKNRNTLLRNDVFRYVKGGNLGANSGALCEVGGAGVQEDGKDPRGEVLCWVGCY